MMVIEERKHWGRVLKHADRAVRHTTVTIGNNFSEITDPLHRSAQHEFTTTIYLPPYAVRLNFKFSTS